MPATFQREGLVKKNIVASLLFSMLVLSACSNFVETNPTAIPTLTLSAIPTHIPTYTPLPPALTANAVSEWNGIPIMPYATAGEGDTEGYVFTVKATAQQVQDYYQAELGKLGWQLVATGEGDASLSFVNNAAETLTVGIVTKGDEVLVLLVK